MITAPSIHAARRRLFTWCLPLIVAGCTTAQPALVPDASLGKWSGRFSITLLGPQGADTERGDNEDRAQGRFELNKQPGRLNLALFSPFGQTMATATAIPGRATLTTANGQVFEAESTSQLVQRALGWRLPVDALPGWLAGDRVASDDRTVTLDGWRVRVEKRLASGKPRILAANWPEKPRADKPRLKLLVVVDGR